MNISHPLGFNVYLCFFSHRFVKYLFFLIFHIQVIQHMQLCHRILPKDWGSEEASVLCESESNLSVCIVGLGGLGHKLSQVTRM